MKKLRVYVETSVIGGCFDDEFMDESRAFINMVTTGAIFLLISDLLLRELELAPEKIRHVLHSLVTNDDSLENVIIDQEAERLRDCYLKAKVVGKSQMNDAMHVALATVAKADVIVSWNFKHIVHFDKIRGFNAVNLREGYLPMEIRSPKEMV